MSAKLPSVMVPAVTHVLDGCRAKLDRAEQHLDTLSAEMKTFMEGDAYAFRSQADETDDSRVVLFEERKQIPITWGVALGDVVHNTRSALDHLVYQLVLLAGATPHNIHQFPIVDTPNDWVKRVQPPKGRHGLLDFIDPAHVATIQGLQPYVAATGLPRLALLRDFSNTDKHRLIHAAYAVLTDTPQISAHMAVPSEITDIEAPAPGAPLEHGAEVARFRIHTDLVFPLDKMKRRDPRLWVPGPETINVEGHPANAQVNVDVKFPVATVFGLPGATYTRAREFRHAIADVRQVVENFAPIFP